MVALAWPANSPALVGHGVDGGGLGAKRVGHETPAAPRCLPSGLARTVGRAAELAWVQPLVKRWRRASYRHTTGHRHVQARHRTQHGNTDQLVAKFCGSAGVRPPSAPNTKAVGTFRSASYSAGRVVRGAHDPDVALLQLAQGAGQVGHHEVRHGFCRTAGHLSATVALMPTGMVLGAMTAWAPAPSATTAGKRPGCAGRSHHPAPAAKAARPARQAGRQRVGLLNVLHRATTPWWRCPHRACRRSSSLSTTRMPASPTLVEELAHALVAARHIHMQLFDGLGRHLQAHGHGVEAE